MSPEETQDFLQVTCPIRLRSRRFCYSHEYEKGDLLIIDDRASLHKAGFDYDHKASIAACIGCWCVAIVLTERGDFGRARKPTMTTTIETRIVRTAPGVEFDVSVAGDPSRPLVFMLHGFCVSRHYWEAQAIALAEAGYFAAAPNQRGYAPGLGRTRRSMPTT